MAELLLARVLLMCADAVAKGRSNIDTLRQNFRVELEDSW
jgi:hypothetical protein